MQMKNRYFISNVQNRNNLPKEETVDYIYYQ